MSVPNPATTKWVPLWNTGASSPAGGGLITGDLVWSVLATRAGAIPCDGALYNSVTDNSFAALYAAIGTTYGGTGPDSFAVPDVRGRLLVCRGSHADVGALGASDGLAVANRTPKHNSTNGLTFAGTFTGAAGGTGIENAAHNHQIDGDTGYVSADHTHSIYDYFYGDGGSGAGRNYTGQGGSFREPSQSTGMRGISANHTHHLTITSGGENQNHAHAFTPAGTIAGTIGGAIGPGGTRPADTPSYIVESCFIVK